MSLQVRKSEVSVSDQKITKQRPVPARRPAVDIIESDEAWTLFADLPGVAADDLEISIEDNRLLLETVSASDFRGPSTHTQKAWRRSFALSSEVLVEEISAQIDAGVLKVELPRRSKPEKRIVPLLSS
jgi:HSP20 family protein